MTDLNKLLREKLAVAKDDFADARTYTWTSNKGVISVGSNNINTARLTALDEVRADLKQLDYILQRIVPNYDELVAQYKAIKDIEEAGE